MKKLILLTIFTLTFGSVMAQAQTPCNIVANLFDVDPNGTNIRGGAGLNFDIIKTVKTNEKVLGFTITADKGSWLKIGGLQVSGWEKDWGRGWIYAPLIGVYAYRADSKGNELNVSLHAAPNSRGKVVASVPSRTPLALQGCSGNWVKVSHNNQTGWLDEASRCVEYGGENDQCPFEIHEDQ